MKLKELPSSLYHSVRLRYGGGQPKKGATVPVIISLTSIPSRLQTLDIVIKGLLSQSHPPQQIILWLNKALKENVPSRLTELEGGIFEVRYCEGTSSYRKLLPTLKLFPDSIIVTCDDDMIYPKNWLSHLYQGHLHYPMRVISQVGRLISRDSDKELMAYNKWPFVREECKGEGLLPIGYGGILYPKNIFSEQVFDENIYMDLCPKADDLWFKAMAYLNGKKTFCVSEKARPIPLLRSQKNSLNSSNIKKDGNRIQWEALCRKYSVLRII